MELEEGLSQMPLVVRDRHDLTASLPDPDLPEGLAIQQRMKMRVLPFWLEPVAVRVAESVVRDEEIAYPLVIICTAIVPKFQIHLAFLWKVILHYCIARRVRPETLTICLFMEEDLLPAGATLGSCTRLSALTHGIHFRSDLLCSPGP